MAKCKPSHCCPRMCTCTPLEDLVKLHQELKCLRKRAKSIKISSNVDKNCIFEMSESETKVLDNNVSLRCESILEIIRKQRDSMQKLNIALHEFDDKLCSQEKEICQADNEIADLKNQICIIKKMSCGKKCNTGSDESERINYFEDAWQESVSLELERQNQLQVLKIEKNY
ncbi:PREDICTED: uncharacterized protein LOC105368328 [Ceratosolen solmsi marchali]|uniref:Uncharacterized protein LOC105368328 n=1 Tax=Ceratosolen solmsi marchali TaxID=326594 RepID=A0AAJ7E2P1_9HYME|nr:PREDICTED: uncharacterized protein LOC105368328 [Ceratosolen solmsi marchali]